MQAALAIQAALARGHCGDTCPVAARMSVTVGDVVLGVVGTSQRHAIALVGPSVGLGARLLKQVEPGGIIASGEVIKALQAEAPALAATFHLEHPAFVVPGGDGRAVAIHVSIGLAPKGPAVADVSASHVGTR